MTTLRRWSFGRACLTEGGERMDMDILSVIAGGGAGGGGGVWAGGGGGGAAGGGGEVVGPAETAEAQPGREQRGEIAKSAKRTRRGERRRVAALGFKTGAGRPRDGEGSTGWKPVPRVGRGSRSTGVVNTAGTAVVRG